jgi:uncharacterized protein (TIGR02246 family)
MRSKRYLVFTVLAASIACLIGFYCAVEKLDPVELQGEIEAVNDVFMKAVKDRDAAAIAALYTEEAMLLPPNAGFVKGKEAIQGMWQSMADMGIEMVFKTVEVEGWDDTAIEMSTYEIKGPDGTVLDNGKYIVIWKYVEGKWLLHRDIFNSSVPAEM